MPGTGRAQLKACLAEQLEEAGVELARELAREIWLLSEEAISLIRALCLRAETAHRLEWQDWADPIIAQPFAGSR